VVDAKGDIIVTGGSNDYEHGWGIVTLKYSGADGSILWQRYNPRWGNYDHSGAVALDPSGNVIMMRVGHTAKYAAADGAVLWEKPSNGVVLAALAVDSSGNVVLTGALSSDESWWDYYTAKYAAADGALLWEKRIVRAADGQDNWSAALSDDNRRMDSSIGGGISR